MARLIVFRRKPRWLRKKQEKNAEHELVTLKSISDVQTFWKFVKKKTSRCESSSMFADLKRILSDLH